ncbi:MAG: OFA family MFS transporter [Archaeoglobaceae archaeon]|nr:OFA family MFS transporter [Archaeoglobaceae archaeon]MDW7990410.1 OFA family MFS transporter [Archaeoglobaceae archaeon]
MKLLKLDAEVRRWLFVLSGLIINICLGSIYSYSVLQIPLKKLFEAPQPHGFGLKVSATEMQLPFLTFLAFFAITMPLAGRFVEKFGPRKIATIGGLFVSLGWFTSSFSTSPLIFTLLYGVIGGVGVGIVYNCTIVTSGKWFPDKRGLAVGLTLFGFGISPAIVGVLMDYLILCYGVQNTLRILGISFLVIITVCSSILRFPSASWKRTNYKITGLSREKMLKMRSFYGLWICYVIGSLAGLMAIGISKPIGLEIAENIGFFEEEISMTLTALLIPFAICNGIGRPLFGFLTDRLKPYRAAVISFFLIFTSSIAIYFYPTITVYTIVFAIFWLNLGGWLAIAPTATAIFFGMKDYARNYGVVFTAYGVGAVAGNLLVGIVKDFFGSYVAVFPYIAFLAIFGILLASAFMREG